MGQDRHPLCEDVFSPVSGLDRAGWIYHTIFQPLSQREVMSLVFERIANAPSHQMPTLYIDIDATLVDTRHLVLEMFRELGTQLPLSYTEVIQHIARLSIADVGHSYQDTWQIAKLERVPGNEDAYRLARDLWRPMFRTKRFDDWDILFPEVPHFFDGLQKANNSRVQRGKKPLRIVILTGRRANHDGPPSQASLTKKGIVREGIITEFAFRPDGPRTETFKRDFLKNESRRADVDLVAFFDNEPVNFGMSAPAGDIGPLDPFPPRLMPIFVDTVSYTPPDRFSMGIYRIFNFSLDQVSVIP